MAEGFARRYGSDVLVAESAGLAPASIVQLLTKKVMEAKNINIDDQFPKSMERVNFRQLGLVVNMSGSKLPTRLAVDVRDWEIEDPIGRPEELYLKVRDQIEMQVMQLILELRRDLRKKQGVTRPERKVFTGAGPRSK